MEKTIEITVVQINCDLEVTTRECVVSTVTDHTQLLMEINEAYGLDKETDVEFIDLVVRRRNWLMFELMSDRGHTNYIQVIW